MGDGKMARTALLIISVCLLATGARGGGKLTTLSAGPHLFVDDYLIAEQHGLVRTVNHPERLSGPVVTGPEDKCFQPYVTVVRDPETKRFRMWYGIPFGEGSTSRSHLAYMESSDGIHWIRPHKVLQDPSPIQFGVSIIDEGPKFGDASKRFKYAWWYDGGLRVASSPDGFTWTPMSSDVVLAHNHDISSIFRDPIRGRYGALVSSYTTGDKWTGNRRIPMMSTSTDLVHWKQPWRVIEPDEKDEGETQFYCMAGVIARGGLLIGLLKVLRDEVVAEGAPQGAYGVGYTVLAWSRDGEHWERDREPFLPRNPTVGAWDHAMTWGDCQLVVGNEVFIYYGGYQWGHKWERFTQRQIGLARMPIDRYVSRDAGEDRGTLRTPLVTIHGTRMTVNANVEGGMQVRLLDSSGKPVPGFDWTDCSVIRGDSTHHEVRWKGSLASLDDRPVRLEFALRKARLYGFDILR